MDTIITLLILCISVYIMKKCSSSFDIAASFLTRNLGEGIKGPTINAIASSLPELLITSIFLFYFKDINGFLAGYATIVGSSVFNIAIIPVIAYLFVYILKGTKTRFIINKSIIKQDTFFLLGAILILSLGFYLNIGIYLSLLLMVFYVIYIIYIIKNRVNNISKNGINYNIDIKKNNFLSSIIHFKLFHIFFNGKVNTMSSLFVVFVSVVLITISCFFLVNAIDDISKILNIHLFFCAFIIAAIASSIPDTILSVQDALNNKFSDSFSNAYGSNIFDICIGIGLPVFIFSLFNDPIIMNIEINRIGYFIGEYIFNGNLFIWSLFLLFCFTVLISFVYYKFNFKIPTAIILVILYLLFITSLVLF